MINVDSDWTSGRTEARRLLSAGLHALYVFLKEDVAMVQLAEELTGAQSFSLKGFFEFV